jgi:iron complex outermembrane receptor protein
MIRTILLSFFLFFACFICSQSLISAQSNLFGIVRDAETKELLFAATIQVNPQNAVTTDLGGSYSIVFSSSDKEITVTYTGYKTLILPLNTLKQGKNDIYLQAENQNLSPTVISGSRFERKITEESVSIEVLKTSFLNNNNATNLSEAIDRVPGVQVLDGQANIRNGSGYAYGAGSRVLVMVDEQPLLAADLSDAKWNFMPIENADQIEIVKSAASVLYGASALNGVIHLRTAQATSTPYTNITTYIGSYDAPANGRRWWTDERTQHPFQSGIYAAHRQKFGENLDMTLGMNVHYSQGYIRGVDEQRYRLNANFRYRLPKNNKWTLALNTSFMRHGEGHFFLWRDGYTQNYVPANDPVSLDVYHTLSLDPSITYRPNETEKHALRGRYFLVKSQRGGGNLDLPASISNVEYQYQKQWADKGISLNSGLMFLFLATYLLPSTP